MRDDMSFETRLAEAFGQLADLAPAMDDEAIVREALATGGPARGGWLATLRNGLAPRVVPLLVVLGLVLATVLAALATGAFRTDPLRPRAQNGVIAYTLQGNDHSPAGTHLMGRDGTSDRLITADRCPAYSADGRVLAWLSYNESASLFVGTADGTLTHTLFLVDDAQTSVSYALSPDGSRVVWTRPTTTGAVELWAAAIDAGPGTRIVSASDRPNEVFDGPIWSPDGGHIAFGGYVADNATGERRRTAIYVVGPDGNGLRSITTRPGTLDDDMAWSPDGRSLVYLAVPDAGAAPSAAASGASLSNVARDIFVIGVDGTYDRDVTSSPEFERRPVWSPDGSSLAFESSPDGEAHRLTTVHMNGPTAIDAPNLGPEAAWFAWSPDGTSLLWVETTSIGSEAYRSTFHSIDPDLRGPSTTLRSLDGLIVCAPSWQRLDPS